MKTSEEIINAARKEYTERMSKHMIAAARRAFPTEFKQDRNGVLYDEGMMETAYDYLCPTAKKMESIIGKKYDVDIQWDDDVCIITHTTEIMPGVIVTAWSSYEGDLDFELVDFRDELNKKEGKTS